MFFLRVALCHAYISRFEYLFYRCVEWNESVLDDEFRFEYRKDAAHSIIKQYKRKRVERQCLMGMGRLCCVCYIFSLQIYLGKNMLRQTQVSTTTMFQCAKGNSNSAVQHQNQNKKTHRNRQYKYQ